MRSRVLQIVLVAAVLLSAGRAFAPFHLAVIDQVFLGSADCPNAQYVVMRTLAAGQNFVQGQTVRAQHGDGSMAAVFATFAMNMPNGASGARFIVGTAEAAGLFGLTLDQTATGTLDVGSGRVCFGLSAGNPVDCVAYGDFTGDNGSRGAPAPAPPAGMALVRQSNTGTNADDFAVGDPAPQNNAGMTGTLGQCPAPIEPTPTVTPGAGGCAGDCNGDGHVAINELILGVSIALDAQNLSACPSLDANGSGRIEINELIAAVNAAINGC
jgi:hypothetical protein